MLYDLLYPWGKGSVEAQRSEGVIATAQAPSGPCGLPKPGCGKIFPWQHLDGGRSLSEEGGSSSILLPQVPGGSSLRPVGGGGGRSCGPEVRPKQLRRSKDSRARSMRHPGVYFVT